LQLCSLGSINREFFRRREGKYDLFLSPKKNQKRICKVTGGADNWGMAQKRAMGQTEG